MILHKILLHYMKFYISFVKNRQSMKTSLQFVMNNLNFKIFAHKIMTRAVHVPAEFLYLSRF